jgi:glycosyltransferase involved in cell wall biosynthesis
MPRPSLSIIVPALNEEQTLAKTVSWTAEVLAGISDDYEVIVVDDGSTDATGRIADELARANPHVRVLHNPAPTGYGGALDTGFAAARKDVLGIITADCEFWPTELPRFLDEMARANVDIVTSTVPNRPYPPYRKLLSWGWRTCMKVLLGECPTLEGIFVMRRSIYNAVKVSSTSGMWAMELLIRAEHNGARSSVIPMELHPREDLRQSKVANLRTTVKVFTDIWKLRGQLNAQRPAART